MSPPQAARPGVEPAPSPTDEGLAQASQAGSLAPFEQLVFRYEQRLYRFLLRKTGNHHDAEDLLQTTFARAYQQIGRYNPSYKFGTWLYTIANRLAISHFRRARPTVEAAPDDAVEHLNPSAIAARKETAESVWNQARRHLPDSHYTALWLRYGEDLSIKEIARIVGKSQASIDFSHRARKSLADKLVLSGETTPVATPRGREPVATGLSLKPNGG